MRKKIKTNWCCGWVGFSLSEVLIALVVIGIVAALTVATVHKQIRREQYRSALFKQISVVNQAAIRYKFIYGENPRCGYWEKSPYSGARCVSRDSKGRCTKYEMSDGSSLPSDYNGIFDDCGQLWKSFYETMAPQKICRTNAYLNGCIPKYKGRDSLYTGKNPDASDYDVNVATSSGGFMQTNILSGSAIVLSDGTIIFTYLKESAQYFAVDVNGHRGPNKWGFDLYVIQPYHKNETSPPKYKYTNSLLDFGGISVRNMIN